MWKGRAVRYMAPAAAKTASETVISFSEPFRGTTQRFSMGGGKPLRHPRMLISDMLDVMERMHEAGAEIRENLPLSADLFVDPEDGEIKARYWNGGRMRTVPAVAAAEGAP